MKSFFRMISFCLGFLLITNVNASNRRDFEGTIYEMVSDDFENKKSERFYLLKEKLSEKLSKIEFKNKKPAWLRSGAKVKVKGKKARESILVDEMSLNGENSSTEESSMELGLAGVNTTVFIFLNSSDGTAYASFDQVSTWMYAPTNSVADLFHKNSRGKFSLNGDRDNNGVLDHHTVNINISTEGTCPYGTMRSEAIKQLSDQGITITDYDHRMYIMPANASCGWAGLASVGGGYSYYASGGSFVYAHELGHNFGLRHSGTDPENDGVSNSTYGDHSCPQGNARGLKFFNAPHSQKLGWTEENQIQDISNGSYVVSALEDDPGQINHPQIFRINKGDTNEKYFLSLRRPVSYETTLKTTYTAGISLHRWKGSGNTSFIKALVPGETFRDDTNSIVISVSSLENQNNSATFSVSAGEVCVPSTPSMVLNPSSIDMTNSGNYQALVNVTNNDNSNCPATTFSLTTTYPENVSGSFSEPSFSLSPGATKQVSLTLVNSGLAATTKIPIKLSDTDGDEYIHTEVNQDLTLLVNPAPPVCEMMDPEMVLSPSSLNVTATGDYQVQVKVTNKDNSYCDPTKFALSTIFPENVSGSFNESNFLLSPGATKVIFLSLTNSGLAASSQMPIKLKDIDGNSFLHQDVNQNLSLIVDTPPPTCGMMDPEMSLNPSSLNLTQKGDYQVQVDITNKDDIYCEPTTFSLSSVYPENVTGSFSESSFALAPGASKQIILSLVNSGLSASAEMPIILSDSDGNSYLHKQVIQDLSLIVDTPPPTCGMMDPQMSLNPNSLNMTVKGDYQVQINVINQDDAFCEPTTFSLSTVFPENVSGSFSESSFNLEAGATKVILLSLSNTGLASSTVMPIKLSDTDGNAYLHQEITQDLSLVIDPPPPACGMMDPAMSLNPNSLDVTALGSFEVQVNITNKDDSYCEATEFSLTTIYPDMVSGSFSESRFLLDPGASKQVNLTLINAGLAASTKLPIKLSDTDGNSYLHQEMVQELSLLVNNPPPPECVIMDPEMSLNPNSLNVTEAGTYQIEVSVQNKDNSYCESTMFSLSTEFPDMMSGSFSESNFALAPGASKQVILSLVNAGLAESSNMEIQLSDIDGDKFLHNEVSEELSLIVDVPPPPISTPEGFSASVHKNGKVTLNWDISEGAVGYKVYRVNQDSGEVSYLTTENKFVEFPGVGVFSYSVSAIDAQGNESDRSYDLELTIEKSRGGKGGKGNGNGNGGKPDKPGKGKGKKD